jgi:hypothetical protein
MSKQFLHVAFNFSDGDPKITKLKPVFDKAVDWYRYTPNCWIVWTSSSAERWYERLRPYIKDDDSMLIVKIDPSDRQGWVSTRVWQWLKDHEEEL